MSSNTSTSHVLSNQERQAETASRLESARRAQEASRAAAAKAVSVTRSAAPKVASAAAALGAVGSAERIIRTALIKGPTKAQMDALAKKTYAKLNAAAAARVSVNA